MSTNHSNLYPFRDGRTMVVLEGQLRQIEFVDVYVPDPSVGMVGEPGWYVVPTSRASFDDDPMFLSTDGVLYSGDEENEPIGEHAGLMVRAARVELTAAMSEVGSELAELREELRGLGRTLQSRTEHLA